MFDILNQFHIKTDIPLITDNYTILHFDEYPILFSGTNRFGNKVIGSLAYEDDDIFRFFHLIVDSKQYFNFIKGSISYLDLLRAVNDIFVIDKDINNKVLDLHQLEFNDIPEDYLPMEESFCPKPATNKSLSFSFSLQGKLADLHKAFVFDINSINSRISIFLESSLNPLRDLALSFNIYNIPSTEGSYKLNYDVDFNSNIQYELFNFDKEKVSAFVNHYLIYLTNSLPKEKQSFLESNLEDSLEFKKIKTALQEVYSSANLSPASTINEKLSAFINESAILLSNVSDYIGTSSSFNKVEVKSQNRDLCLVTDEYSKSVQDKLIVVDLNNHEHDKIETDSDFKEYRILMYDLNTETGVGKARLYYEGENFQKVSVKIILNDKKLNNTLFSNSLNEDKVVTVKGRATKINGTYKKLECSL